MPKRSKAELMGLVGKIIEMYHREGMSQRAIADWLREQGYEVGKNAVSRALKSHAKRLEELQKKQDWAETLIAATNKTPRLDIADAGLQIAAMKLLEEVDGIEDLGELDADQKITLLTRVSRAIGLAANVELNFERGRKQGIIEAKEKIADAARDAGVEEDRIKAFITKALIGIEPPAKLG